MAIDPPLLRVRGLAKRFGARVAVEAADFALWPGEVLAVVGESGAGKTHPAALPLRPRAPTRARSSIASPTGAKPTC